MCIKNCEKMDSDEEVGVEGGEVIIEERTEDEDRGHMEGDIRREIERQVSIRMEQEKVKLEEERQRKEEQEKEKQKKQDRKQKRMKSKNKQL